MKNPLLRLSAAIVLSLGALSVSASTQYTIDFEDPDFVAPGGNDFGSDNTNNWGQVIDDEYVGRWNGIDVTFWTSIETGITNFDGLSVNPNDAVMPVQNLGGGKTLAPYLVLFNTNFADSDDNDLEVGRGGYGRNNDPDLDRYEGNNIAIINENFRDRNYDYVEHCETVAGELACSDPDDRFKGGNGAPYGGWVFVNFSQPVNLHSIDLIDMETHSNQRGSFGFYDANDTLVGFQSMTPTTLNTNQSDGNGGWLTHTWDDNSLSTFTSYAMNVTTLVLRMQGSGGFDNIVFSVANQEVPEPEMLALLLLGLGFVATRSRKQN